MSLDDVFGPSPGRPQHPDFAKLVDVVLQHDGKTEEPLDYGAYLAEMLDPDSLTYMGRGRATTFLQRSGKNPELNQQFLVMLATIFVDGFTIGYKYRERYGDQQ